MTRLGVAILIDAHQHMQACRMSSSKRKRSNEQRLKAVEEKKARLHSRQLTIKVTNGVSASNQHVVFTSDSEDSSSHQGNEQRLELFGEDESESEAEQEVVNWGEKFERGRRAELFQLQQKIGHDARFRVDERFLEDEQNEVMIPLREDEGSRRETSNDDIGEQMEREKANALRIINSMFGGGCAEIKEKLNGGQKLASANHTRILPLRYDPDSDTCAELELIQALPSTPPPLQETYSPNGEHLDPPDTCSPAQLQADSVSINERYYSVNEDIQQLFSSSNEKFSFLTDMDRDLDNNDPSVDHSSSNVISKDRSAAQKWIKNINRVLSSSSSEDSEVESVKVTPTGGEAASVGSAETRLFFHSSSPRLCNRLEENSFYRSEALSELELNWPQRRTAMKQSFRKRRKDAMKMAKKKRKIH